MSETPPLRSNATASVGTAAFAFAVTAKFLYAVFAMTFANIQLRRHCRVVECSKIALGNKLQASGIGRSELMEELRVLDQRIAQTRRGGGSLSELNRTRRLRLVELAEQNQDTLDTSLLPEQSKLTGNQQRQINLMNTSRQYHKWFGNLDAKSWWAALTCTSVGSLLRNRSHLGE